EGEVGAKRRVEGAVQVAGGKVTPLPNPPPQGGREHAHIRGVASSSSANALRATAAALLFATLLVSPASAQTAAPKIDAGDTAWMIAATALVLMMTIPGLALF